MIHRHRGNRRKQNYIKAARKEKIARSIYGSALLSEEGWHYFSNLNQYSKGKIHCSCPMCSQKTNMKHNKKNYKVSDIKKINSMGSQLEEYYENA